MAYLLTLEVALPGPVPKPESQRRRRNKPKSYGEADAVKSEGAVVAPVLGFEAPHDLVESLWDSLATSVEGKYFSPADWQRARIELHFLNELLNAGRLPGAQAWAAVQSGLSALLISPADKRRVGIELQAVRVDEDEDAAVSSMDAWRAKLGG